MANEISVSATMSVSKSGASVSLSAGGSLTMAGVNMVGPVTETIATSATQITMPNITGVPPAILIKNLDATNYLEVDIVNTFNSWPQKIQPGCCVLLAPESATIYGKAHTASVQIAYCVCEP